MYCTYCGTHLHENAEHCTECGKPIEANKGPGTGLIITGYVMALLIPIVGIGMGIYCMVKDKVEVGLGMIGLSCVSWALTAMWLM